MLDLAAIRAQLSAPGLVLLQAKAVELTRAAPARTLAQALAENELRILAAIREERREDPARDAAKEILALEKAPAEPQAKRSAAKGGKRP